MKENFSIIDDDKIFVHHLSSVQFLGSVNQVQANKSAHLWFQELLNSPSILSHYPSISADIPEFSRWLFII